MTNIVMLTQSLYLLSKLLLQGCMFVLLNIKFIKYSKTSL